MQPWNSDMSFVLLRQCFIAGRRPSMINMLQYPRANHYKMQTYYGTTQAGTCIRLTCMYEQ